MAEQKKELLTVRISPQIKAALLVAADNEQLNITEMVEIMVTCYCRMYRIPLTSDEGKGLTLRFDLSKM